MASTVDPAGALSARLRTGTRVGHDVTHGGGFLRALTAGVLPREAYTDLVAQYFFVYEALESAAEAMAGDPVAGVFVFPELRRLPTLVADLEALCGPGWADGITALPATVAYCARLREVAFDSPMSFVAHHCTRHLGDLADGGDISRAVARVYGIGPAGCRFYAVEGVDPAAVGTRYRDLLDATAWQPAAERYFLAEVSRAHRLTAAVLDGLRRRWS
jgi:heme oxygenase